LISASFPFGTHGGEVPHHKGIFETSGTKEEGGELAAATIFSAETFHLVLWSNYVYNLPRASMNENKKVATSC